jgi:membrane protein involved in colicin uptake
MAKQHQRMEETKKQQMIAYERSKSINQQKPREQKEQKAKVQPKRMYQDRKRKRLEEEIAPSHIGNIANSEDRT